MRWTKCGAAASKTRRAKVDADEKLLHTLGDDSPKKRGFVKGLAQALYFGEKEAWADRIVNAAVTKNLAEAAIVELLLALPSQRSTWDAAARLGNNINSLFWKGALFFAHIIKLTLATNPVRPRDRSIRLLSVAKVVNIAWILAIQHSLGRD